MAHVSMGQASSRRSMTAHQRDCDIPQLFAEPLNQLLNGLGFFSRHIVIVPEDEVCMYPAEGKKVAQGLHETHPHSFGKDL